MVAAENVVADIAKESPENNECVLNWKCTDVHLIFCISFSASGKRFLYSYVLLNFCIAIEILHFGDFFGGIFSPKLELAESRLTSPFVI